MNLFVYGILRKNQPLHLILSINGAKCINNNKTLENYGLFVGDKIYPFCSFKEGSSLVGEVYEINDDTLKDIEDIETEAGYTKVFRGDLIFFEYPDVSGLTHIEHGDWLRYLYEEEIRNA